MADTITIKRTNEYNPVPNPFLKNNRTDDQYIQFEVYGFVEGNPDYTLTLKVFNIFYIDPDGPTIYNEDEPPVAIGGTEPSRPQTDPRQPSLITIPKLETNDPDALTKGLGAISKFKSIMELDERDSNGEQKQGMTDAKIELLDDYPEGEEKVITSV